MLEELDEGHSEVEEEINENMKVFLRLRPMNKLETSRRSKNCVELHDDPRSLTVDSPLEGEYDFTFDHVFEEYASQQEVFEQAIIPVPSKLLEGYHCAVLAFGQTGTGKTHTMMGHEEGDGMVPTAVKALFDLIETTSTPSIEYTLRCSFVEIYLEKILDLLLPGNEGPLRISRNGILQGAAEICCLDSEDVLKLIARGIAHRTQSSTEMNTDSSRSSVIFILKLLQIDTSTGAVTESTLHMLDLAGSEMASQRTGGDMSAVQAETKMINKSLTELNRMIKRKLDSEQSKMPVLCQSNLSRLLYNSFGGNCYTTLLLTASSSSYNIGETINTIRFGQRCRRIQNNATTNVDWSRETYRMRISTEEQKLQHSLELVKALARECRSAKADDYESSDRSLWDNIDSILEENSESENKETPVALDIIVRKKADTSSESRIDGASSGSTPTPAVRDDVEEQLTELQSEVAVLRSQNEELTVDKKRHAQELVNAKNEIQLLSQRKAEVEHNLRTSQFRENEAIVFLRQFRRFYRNVLRDKAKHGSGSLGQIGQEISDKAANAPDLSQLVDVDALLLESGLIEHHELSDDKSGATYRPSKEALLRSAIAAQKAAEETEALEKECGGSAIDEDGSSYVTTGTVKSSIRRIGPLQLDKKDGKESISDVGDGGISQFAQLEKTDGGKSSVDADSIGERDEANCDDGPDAGAGSSASMNDAETSSKGKQSALSIDGQAKLLMTPSGRLATMREKDLENELLEMSERCIDLQMALNEEKATVDVLTNRSGGLSKKKLAQEAIALRQQLEKMNENLMAIAWKMNELNLINKSYNEKMINREQHVIYLEENLVDLQNTNRRIVLDRQEMEKKLREEVERLKKVIDGMAVPLWQFGEEHSKARSLSKRIIIPVPGGTSQVDFEAGFLERRMSRGELEPDSDTEEEKDQIEPNESRSDAEVTEAATQTDEDSIEKADVEIQTDATIIETEVAGLGTPDQIQTNGLNANETSILTDTAVDASIAGIDEDVETFGSAENETRDLEGEDRKEWKKWALGAGLVAASGAVTAGVISAANEEDDRMPQALEAPDTEASSDALHTARHEDNSDDEIDTARKLLIGSGVAGSAAVACTMMASIPRDNDHSSEPSESHEGHSSDEEHIGALTETDITSSQASASSAHVSAPLVGDDDVDDIDAVPPVDSAEISSEGEIDDENSDVDVYLEDTMDRGDGAEDEDVALATAPPRYTNVGKDEKHGDFDADLGKISSEGKLHDEDSDVDLYLEDAIDRVDSSDDEGLMLAAAPPRYANVGQDEKHNDEPLNATDSDAINHNLPVLNDDMLQGGRPREFEPRRFVIKLGTQIGAGVVKPPREQRRSKEGDLPVEKSSSHERKKKKSSSEQKKKKKKHESKKKSRDRDDRGERERKSRKSRS